MATDVQLQLFYSMLDQQLHLPRTSQTSTRQILEDTQNKYYSLPYVSDTVSLNMKFAFVDDDMLLSVFSICLFTYILFSIGT